VAYSTCLVIMFEEAAEDNADAHDSHFNEIEPYATHRESKNNLIILNFESAGRLEY
jgi:hypothetical protein